ncbi:DNA-directed RNA polymerase, mitochondrial isoform X2 [Anthonomus grandis grandis]|uniref:DNA-directed RNA polymerase, mitochondrial isoform X2 n=1 Tax=Anthonomus grandis grandis TaxID=2921223 RepID=UPI002165EA31|nr:DNA-directed RNA polymerase, mitochondrial isoform X2 [Anthonomus grandis grandis]
MFQLLRKGSSSIDKSRPMSIFNLSGTRLGNLPEKTCLLCKLLNASPKSCFPTREYSSVTNLSLNSPKRRKLKKKLSKAYSDILVVTNESSKFKKANVTKLTPSDLNLLMTTNINLNELYKLKDLNSNLDKFVPHTYSNLTVEDSAINLDVVLPSDTKPELTPKVKKNKTKTNKKLKSVITESAEEEMGEADHVLHSHPLQPELIEDTPDLVEIQPLIENSKRKITHREHMASKTLGAFIEVCNHLKNPYRGFTAFLYHQSKSKQSGKMSGLPKLSPIKNINVYYTLLKGFADKQDYGKIVKILDIMAQEDIKPDLNCYTAIFECLGRLNHKNYYLKEIRIQTKEMLECGITFDQIMNQGIFLNDGRDQVLKAFKAYDESYFPKYEKPNFWYNNCLLNHLNNKDQYNFEVKKPRGYGEFIEASKMQELLKKQTELEEKGYLEIKSVDIKNPPPDVDYYRQTLKEHYEMWTETVQVAFQRDLAALTAQRGALNFLEPYLRCIPMKDMVELIVQEAERLAHGSETYSPQVPLLNKMLGAKVYARYQVLRKQKTGVMDKMLSVHSKYCQHYAASHTELESLPTSENRFNSRIQWQHLELQNIKLGTSLNIGHQPWVPVTLMAIGRFLYNIILSDLKIDVNSLRSNTKHKNLLPAFYRIFRSQGRLVKEEVKPHPILCKLYKASHSETLKLPANEVPMYCPPVPWTSVENGGYIIVPTDLVRLPVQASSQRKRMADAGNTQLYPNFDALNQLAGVPWKVNQKVLNIILEVFQNGGSSKLDVPEPSSSLKPPPVSSPDMERNDKYQILKQKLQYRRKKAEMHSLWCDCLYRLSLANHYKDDVFWLPHNMDFRGRVYPVPPHLNHLGSDLARSMLVFAEPRPLGKHGLDWLKIHLINLTGLKKRDSIQDRLEYANDMMGLILDSADKPLTGQKWWTESDEPWQTLACCIEIADVVRSGMNSADYLSHFPVHQDGSCNGLQHYAALGRDQAGAFSVNLTASETPQDVYSAVVALVEERRARDEENGVEIAKLLKGFIKRKVIKQTIMTTVYGVTKFGAKLQIAKQLKDIEGFPKDAVWAASPYLTECTFDSLQTMFTSTKEIQDWFTQCARMISGPGGSLVEWVTPLGLPVVQPYIKYKKTSMPHGYESFALDQFEKPNLIKQKNAFPPNFIHSLDSSHMMLTSLHCERAGITFVSVHDCYWTHPSTIQIMNKICREQFVALHSQPILEDLSVFLFDRYSYDLRDLHDDMSVAGLNKKKLNQVLRQLPKTGDFDIKNVLNSVYFFS